MHKTFFILGLRRSGTSILRQIILKNPSVSNIEFEPHEIFHAVSVLKLSRYKNNKFYNNVIRNFNRQGGNNKWHGAKLVLNPGIDSLDWIWLPDRFPNSKIIFIIRNPISTYKSYTKQDAKVRRGVIGKEPYLALHKQIVNSFKDWANNNIDRSCAISYDNMLKHPNNEINKVWKLLGVPKTDISKLVKTPKH